MPDTTENQEAYPKHGSQKKGVGNPLLRIEVLTVLGSGAVLAYAVAPYKGKQTGEVALFRQLVGQLKAGDIFLADAIFENYFLLAKAS